MKFVKSPNFLPQNIWYSVMFVKLPGHLIIHLLQYMHYINEFVVTVEQDNQGDLEMATEMLSEYMERDITNSSLQDLKIIVMDKTK